MLHKLVIEDLPPDCTSQQNAAIITYPHSRTWPLVLDSLGIAEQWLRGREKEAATIDYQVLTSIKRMLTLPHVLNFFPPFSFSFMHSQDSGMHGAVLKAIEEGSTLLISNVATAKLADDLVLLDVLQCRRSLYRSKNIVKYSVSSTWRVYDV